MSRFESEPTTKEESVAGARIERIAELLGSQPPIYVGNVSVVDTLTGATIQKVRVAKRARDIAATAEAAEEPDVLGRALGQLTKLIDEPSDLTETQKDAIADNISRLVGVYDRSQDGENPFVTVRQLYDTYFAYQGTLAETEASHTLRTLGDDFAIEKGIDLDFTWTIYEDALARAQASGGR